MQKIEKIEVTKPSLKINLPERTFKYFKMMAILRESESMEKLIAKFLDEHVESVLPTVEEAFY